MNIDFKEKSEIRVIQFPERVDISTVPKFKDSVLSIVNETKLNIVINMTATRFIDSTGIGYIIMLMKTLLKDNRKLIIANPDSNIKGCLNSTRVLNFIEVIYNEEL
jgi:anti-anti-sigma factor